MATTKDTERLLEQWGIWARQGANVRGLNVRGYQAAAMITDDDALLIDRLVARLGQRYEECAEVIVRYYTSGATFRIVGKRMGFGEEKARQLWKAGVAWVDGALEVRRVA